MKTRIYAASAVKGLIFEFIVGAANDRHLSDLSLRPKKWLMNLLAQTKLFLENVLSFAEHSACCYVAYQNSVSYSC